MFFNLLTWLDSSPAHYWIVAWSSFAICAALALSAFFYNRFGNWRGSSILFIAAMLAAILAFRWPILLDNQRYADPDESQFIAEAAKLRSDPLFWRSVDGSTHGPLTDWPLVVASFLRGSLDYTAARVVSALMVWIELTCAWLIFRHFYKSVASVLVLPLLCAHAFTDLWRFVAYCSEHIPNALFALGCCFLALSWGSSGAGFPRRGRLFAAGVFFGAIPFAKLQGAPIAAVGIAAGMWFLIADRSLNWHQRRRSLLSFVIGVATIPGIIMVVVLIGGIWSDFFNSYILDNIRYAGANKFPPEHTFTWSEAPRMLITLGAYAQNFNLFILGLTAFGLGGSLLFPFFAKWRQSWIIFSAVATIVACAAAMAPGRPYLHYLQLIIFPVGLFGGLVAGAVVQDVEFRSLSPLLLRAVRVFGVSGFLICGVIPQVWWRAMESPKLVGRFTETQGALAQSEVSREILRHGTPGERLAIWGYMPVFWVETGLIEATRDAETSHQIEPNEYRDYYRDRFLQDLLRCQPPVFIDAVGAGNFAYEDRNEFAHETFPELTDYLGNNYHLVGDIEGTRIYVRNDRL